MCTLLGGIGRLNVTLFQQKYVAKSAAQRRLQAIVFGEDTSSQSSSSSKRVEGGSKSRNGGTRTKEQQQEIQAEQQAYQVCTHTCPTDEKKRMRGPCPFSPFHVLDIAGYAYEY